MASAVDSDSWHLGALPAAGPTPARMAVPTQWLAADGISVTLEDAPLNFSFINLKWYILHRSH